MAKKQTDQKNRAAPKDRTAERDRALEQAEKGTGAERDQGYAGSSDVEAQNTGTSGQATDEQLKEDRARQRGY